MFQDESMLSKKVTLSLSALFTLSLSACSTHPIYNGHAPHNNKHHHKSYVKYEENNYPRVSNWQFPENNYRPVNSSKLLSNYTEQLAMKLIENMNYINSSTPIAITSFVNLDDNLQTTNIFGNHLAESFISELQEFGLSVVDYKHTGAVHVTPMGDFSFSRNGQEIKGYPHIEYTLSGTLTYTNRGVIVNARIIGAKSKVVVSSAKGFIPSFIVESLYPTRKTDGIMLDAIQ
jgi:TolB-like protein|tara:strand:- start:515 stop:1210 length:696 start_codon:yes stop_codon:yes gene_type:complete